MSVIDQHQRIALQLSGGRDSLACLYLLRPHWDRLTVYWLNSGDAFPEVRALMDEIRAMVPDFVEVDGRQPEVVAQFGPPTDLMPADSHPIGLYGGSSGLPLQQRFDCCWRVLMEPMHRRMLADGITLIIRGQRADDALKARIHDGDVLDGIAYHFPIEAWNAQQVNDYLASQGVALPRFYQTLALTPDCVSCTAWWSEGRAAYLRHHHPDAHARYMQGLDRIQQAVAPHIAAFNQEIQGETDGV
ncbi:phosphoadenosine phosphosulfate reductase family protein [Chromobacterium vaccinii]|uniref:phosphoadenosine phosphosulfate reductase domain-containing protein n=1 Tax=Chromobacterium vaccinii TaxID=1108595 RepID=UPI0031D83D39